MICGSGVRIPVLPLRFSFLTPSGHVSRVAPPPLRSMSIEGQITGSDQAPGIGGSDSLVDKVSGLYPGLRGSNPHPA